MAGPSATASRLSTSTRPPATSGSRSSSTETSKERVLTASRVSPAPKPSSVCIERRKLATAPCRIITPLGRPVEPEVYIT